MTAVEPTRPQPRPGAWLRIAGIMGTSGVTHFVRPQLYDPIVPRWLPGPPRAWTYASGAFEVTAAVLLVRSSTRRAGGALAFVTLLGVYPANIQAALDGGIPGAKPPFNSAAASWLRLPLQLPMLRDAWRVARGS